MKIEDLGKKLLLGLGAEALRNTLAGPVSTQHVTDVRKELLNESLNQSSGILDFLSENKEKFNKLEKRLLVDEKPTISNNWSEKVFAPYVHMRTANSLAIDQIAKKTGNLYYTLAFMGSNKGFPSFYGQIDYTTDIYNEQLSNLRDSGGDIIMSFGGASSNELAVDITDVLELQKAYQNVIDKFKLTWIDMDIEGSALKNVEANERRNKAILGLQKDNPNLVLSYCLPVTPRGLMSESINLIKDAIKQGVRIDVVNVMAMDYSKTSAPDPEGKMGHYAIEAAKSTKKQLEKLGLDNTKIGITAMIGINDEEGQIFDLADAKRLLQFAKETDYVRMLGFWSINRDNADCSVNKLAASRCSGIEQELYEFTNTFKEFNENVHTDGFEKDIEDNRIEPFLGESGSNYANYVIFSLIGVGIVGFTASSLVYLYKKDKKKGVKESDEVASNSGVSEV